MVRIFVFIVILNELNRQSRRKYNINSLFGLREKNKKKFYSEKYRLKSKISSRRFFFQMHKHTGTMRINDLL